MARIFKNNMSISKTNFVYSSLKGPDTILVKSEQHLVNNFRNNRKNKLTADAKSTLSYFSDLHFSVLHYGPERGY